MRPPAIDLGMSDDVAFHEAMRLWERTELERFRKLMEAASSIWLTALRLHYWKRHRMIFRCGFLDNSILVPNVVEMR